MAEQRDDQELTRQTTCFIGTVNLGHICKKSNWAEVPEEEIIEELELHWNEILQLPNLKVARGQIERNTSGVLHINFGLKFKKVWRARTLQNKAGCWARPARNEAAVMAYGKKQETRVKELANFGELVQKKKTGPNNPKQIAIAMLLDGKAPAEICAYSPEIFFTHHRAIMETWKMMEHNRKVGRQQANESWAGKSEEE